MRRLRASARPGLAWRWCSGDERLVIVDTLRPLDDLVTYLLGGSGQYAPGAPTCNPSRVRYDRVTRECGLVRCPRDDESRCPSVDDLCEDGSVIGEETEGTTAYLK